MKDFISGTFLVVLVFIFVHGATSIVENYKLFAIKAVYCKQHREDSLEEFKLCNSNLVTFYKRKINNDR